MWKCLLPVKGLSIVLKACLFQTLLPIHIRFQTSFCECGWQQVTRIRGLKIELNRRNDTLTLFVTVKPMPSSYEPAYPSGQIGQ